MIHSNRLPITVGMSMVSTTHQKLMNIFNCDDFSIWFGENIIHQCSSTASQAMLSQLNTN